MRNAMISLALTAAVVGSSACARRIPPTAPGTGRVTIGVTTTGAGAEALRFNVSIEPAGVSATVKADAGVFTAPAVPAGDLIIRLTNVPGRCRVAEGAERRMELRASGSLTVRFIVECR